MKLPRNTFKHAILSGHRQIGLWSSLGSPTASEIVGGSGFDWILIDGEHSPIDLRDVLCQLRALMGSAATPVVRPAWNDMVAIKRLLDIGAQTLLVPYIQNADEAARAVASMRYPPRGVRGVGVTHRANRYGRVPRYFDSSEEELCLLVQLETRESLLELEPIAKIPGVHGIFIGPSDLSASMGHLGNSRHPDVQAAIADALERCQRAGKPAGILTPVEEDARRYLAWGFTFVAVGSDLGLLNKACDELHSRFSS